MNNDEAGFRRLIDKSTIEGVIGTALLFLHARNFDRTSENAMLFADAVCAEFEPVPDIKFEVVPESIRKAVERDLAQALPTLAMLWNNGEKDNVVKCTRVIAGGAAMACLDEHAGSAVAFYKSLSS